jgi:hypothetical protein
MVSRSAMGFDSLSMSVSIDVSHTFLEPDDYFEILYAREFIPDFVETSDKVFQAFIGFLLEHPKSLTRRHPRPSVFWKLTMKTILGFSELWMVSYSKFMSQDHADPVRAVGRQFPFIDSSPPASSMRVLYT